MTSSNKKAATLFWKFSFVLDTFGATASGLCAVHCALIPVILTFYPLLSTGFFHDPFFEWLLIGSSICLALISFLVGYYRHHHAEDALLIMLIAFIFFTLGRPREVETLVSPICMTLGGITMAYAHYRNWKLCKEKKCEICK